ncbi:antA/AntB antirepressor family protein [Anaerotignum propionicum]|uniref:AntA/AntB antirepressor n=1 Tax=Anaerotignum propionicum DSM 1682 TaxID=991789 RepID=A0A0X8VCN0_ANAPI|nr:antA/AntB antirepressor family protein [Anaerotignum propionicum]AMJ40350.1 AntA/AntB antirepressor [Anaerotignum propionicum DSM 1682]SHE44420.1 Phage anti-repressor protein [[Clostridium] propionicum DSM 1682] [Anaerotignum propionicum DSM 1682]
MNQLTVIEKELVPVYETSTGEKVVNGRELWEGLQSKSKFADWIKNRFADCEATENEDFETLSKNLENGGRTKEYIIQLDTAKEMAMLERNEIGKKVRKYFIAVEKKYKTPKSQAEILLGQAQILVNMERKQRENEKAIEDTNKRIDGIKDIVSLNPNDWRKDTARLLNKMAVAIGGYEHLRNIREESYKLLDERFGVSLSIRLTNKKKTMALNGVCKSKVDKLNKLDAIADDKKLIEGYISIIKEMCIRYGIDANSN